MTNNSPIEYVKDSFEIYLAKSDHISSSDIKNFLYSPKYYFYEKFEKKRDDDEVAKRHFIVGSALHELVLEPHEFKKHYTLSPVFDKKTAKGKADYELFQFKLNALKMQGLYPDEWTMITVMATNATKNKTLTELIKDGHREVSCYTVDEPTGLLIRVRPDTLCTNVNTIVDLKTCLSSSKRRFTKDVYEYEYMISAAFYMDFLNRENYVFVSMEKDEPYQVSLYQLDDDLIDVGRQRYRMALDLLKWSRDNNYWCDYIEFEMLKEHYITESLPNFFDYLENTPKINIIQSRTK